MKRIFIALFLLSFTVLAGSEIEPIPYQNFTLDNGLRVVFLEKPDSPVVAIRNYVKVGAIYEDEFLGCGVSHYMEHIVSGGSTSNMTEKESNLIVKECGDNMNAYTTLDHTCYLMKTTREHWAKAAGRIADWVGNCSLDPKEVAREKPVIIQEIKMGDEEPSRVLWNLLQKNAFITSPLRVPTIGYEDNFVSITRDDLVKFYNKNYVANNMVLAIAGNITREELEPVLAETFGKIKRGYDRQWLLTPEMPILSPREEFIKFNVKNTHLKFAFPGVKADSPDLYALDLLARILSAGESSILTKKLKKEKQLVYSISAGNWWLSCANGLFIFNVVCDETNINKVTSALFNELEKLKNNPVDKKHIERARNQILVSHFRSLQSAEGLASSLGSDEISLGNPDFSVNYANKMRVVSTEDIMRVANKYFNTNTVVRVGLIPAKDEESQEKEKASTEKSGKVFNFSVKTLKNGIRVAMQPDKSSQLISFSLHLPGGLVYETPENNGISSFLANMLKRGTKTRSADKIAETIDILGASLNYGASRNAVYGSAECLAKDSDTIVELLADTLINPAFPEDELEKQRRLTLAQIRSQRDQWVREAMLNFSENFFKGHPFAMSTLGTTNVVSNLTPKKLRAFHSQILQPSNIVIAVAGNFDEEKLLKKFERKFGKINAKAELPEKAGKTCPALDNNVHIEDTVRKQATVILGCEAPALFDDDAQTLQVIDGYLGGFGGPLFRALRGDDNLVYATFAFPMLEKEGGALLALAQCFPKNVDTVINKITNMLHNVAVKPVSENELALSKNSVLIPFEMSNETLDRLAVRASYWEYSGKGANYGNNIPSLINKISAGDIQKVAAEYLTNWTCVVTMPE